MFFISKINQRINLFRYIKKKKKQQDNVYDKSDISIVMKRIQKNINNN